MLIKVFPMPVVLKLFEIACHLIFFYVGVYNHGFRKRNLLKMFLRLI